MRQFLPSQPETGSMTSMKDRQDAFERKFVHDEDMKFRALSRRNKLLGLWAAEKLGKTGDDAEAYAREVVKVDFEEAGDQDVVRKLRRDFDAAGVTDGDAVIEQKMNELLLVAIDQVKSA
jgi:hypothetical protein